MRRLFGIFKAVWTALFETVGGPECHGCNLESQWLPNTTADHTCARFGPKTADRKGGL